MNKQLIVVFAMLGIFCTTQNAVGILGGAGSTRQYYRIVKINDPNELHPDQKLIGYVPGYVCGTVVTLPQGAKAKMAEFKCAVVTASPGSGFQEKPGIVKGTETFYYLKETNQGVLQPKNFVAYIQQEKGMPGAKTVGVYKANNY